MVGHCAASGGACRLNCPFPYRTSQSVRFLPKWLQIRSHEPRGGRALRRVPNSIRGEEALLSGASTHVGRAPRENGLRKQDTMSSLFSMKGRVSRRQYAFASLMISLVSYIFVAAIGWISATSDTGFRDATLLGLIVMAASLVVQGVFSVRRLHDLGRRGREVWLILVPFYNIYFMLVLCFSRGTHSEEKNGPAPA